MWSGRWNVLNYLYVGEFYLTYLHQLIFLATRKFWVGRNPRSARSRNMTFGSESILHFGNLWVGESL